MVKKIYTSIPNLVTAASSLPDGIGWAQASGGRWSASRRDISGILTVNVYHYSTLMLSLERRLDGSWWAVGQSRGWGSQTDKVGVGRVLRGCGAVNAGSYRELYQEV